MKFQSPKLPSTKFEPPKIVSDLVSDLRDRGLLLPAILLIIALIAVPVLLSSTSSSMTPRSVIAEPAPKGASALEPAVLTEQVGIRSYRKRLAALKQKNPFERRFALPKVHTKAPGQLAPPPTSTGVPASPTPPTTTPSTSAPPTSTSSTSSSASATHTVTVTTTTSTTATHTHRKPSNLYTHVIDVQVGPLHERRTIKSVHSLTMLPGDHHPVVLYLGSGIDTNTATFSVSSDVDKVNGDGECMPSPASCQYLTMKPGQTETFDYAPEGRVYSLELQRVRTVVVPRNRQTAHLKGNDAPAFPGVQK